MARGLRGFTLVSEGRLDEGMRMLDETATAAIAGELSDPEARGSACCYVLSACENVLDLARAGQWQRQVLDKYGAHDERLGLTFCRKHHIQLLVLQGEWEKAEAEMERFRADLPRELHVFVVEMAMIEAEPAVFLGIAPAGTRTSGTPWRSGFYHIAHAAGVPILPAAFDGERRAIRLFAPFRTSGDFDADLPRLMALYAGIRGIRRAPD